jgi:hypothetical protein
MSFFDKILGKESVSKTEVEQVQKEKEEYKLIDKYQRTKGLILFAYSPMKDLIQIVKVDHKKDAQMIMDETSGKWRSATILEEECVVDSRNIHFEALNMKNAIKRVNKYKNLGKIDELCNLKPPSDPNALALW